MKRWDFDNEEEYNTYQSSREALPRLVISFPFQNHDYIVFTFRAAFQYGVKMSEGRKTRRFGGGMTGKAKEKAKLNREWQQISAVSCRHTAFLLKIRHKIMMLKLCPVLEANIQTF